MEITRIGEKNIDYFSHLTGGAIPPGQSGLGVILDDTAVAAALFSLVNGTATLEHIFVDPDERRRGVGTFLLKEAIEAFSAAGVDTMMAYYNGADEITKFLSKMGFACTESLPQCSVSCDKLINADLFHTILDSKRSENIRYMEKLTTKEQRQLKQILRKNGFDESILDPGRYDPKLSFVIVSDDDITGCMIMKMSGEDLMISLLLSNGELSSLRPILREVAGIVDEKATAGSSIVFVSGNEKLEGFLGKITADTGLMEQRGNGGVAALKMQAI